ncbi:MAG: Nramp family divalent metal transporter [Limisphaerales bacterium]
MPAPPEGIKDPPHTPEGIAKELGPGLIVAGAVVGSGELIATTSLGAEAGFYLMWLIIVGCLIKVFVQVEMGRFAICSGQTSLEGMSKVPGPRIGPANWVLWFWLATIIVTTGQLGGIVGGVGQAMAISAPITQEGKEYNEILDAKTQFLLRMQQRATAGDFTEMSDAQREQAIKDGEALQKYAELYQGKEDRLPELQKVVKDHFIWAGIVAAISILMLVKGTYGFIQTFMTVMVGCFTLMTVINVILLQTNPAFAMTPQEFVSGFSFTLPPKNVNVYPLATALATFGIIGIAAGEMVFYPYWCQEKGYARFVGPNDGTGEWVRRARGWMVVLRVDAFGSMIVYTISTVAFYILGAAILNRLQLVPEKTDMIRTLAAMYEPVFGGKAGWIFPIGAVAVLYSTFFVTNASKARMCTDALRLFKLRDDTEAARENWLTIFCVAFPIACFAVYYVIPFPKQLVLAAGVMQSVLLPVMACTAIYFRYKLCDPRLMPGWKWDVMLWISGFGMLVAGIWAVLTKLFPAVKAFG